MTYWMARSGPGWGRESAFLTSFTRKACPMTPNSNSGEATAAPPPVKKGTI